MRMTKQIGFILIFCCASYSKITIVSYIYISREEWGEWMQETLLYANAHRGKARKAVQNPLALQMVEEDLRHIPSKGWAAMIRKAYEVSPLLCPQCGGRMRLIAFITDYQAVDRIINHLKLTFVADKPPPARIAFQEVLMAAEASAEYFS